MKDDEEVKAEFEKALDQSEKYLKLTELPRALRSMSVTGSTLSYAQAYKGVVEGTIEAQQTNTGRWQIPQSALIKIIEDFEL
jgi:hypothetical protein